MRVWVDSGFEAGWVEGSGAGCMMAWLGQGIPPTLVQLRVFRGGFSFSRGTWKHAELLGTLGVQGFRCGIFRLALALGHFL